MKNKLLTAIIFPIIFLILSVFISIKSKLNELSFSHKDVNKSCSNLENKYENNFENMILFKYKCLENRKINKYIE